jgi:hypothetical protein
LNSTASTTFRVEFFASATCDPTGNGEGQSFLGFANVTTNDSCTASFGPLVFPRPAGQTVITATATDPQGNTSEFSPCFVPVNAVSRKLHNGHAFDIDLPFANTLGVEPRSGGATNDFQVVFNFPSPVTFTGATVTSGVGTASSSSGSGTTAAIVNLTGVTNAQKITVTLSNVNNGTTTADLSVPMGVLVGDANGDGFVNSADATITRNRSGQTTDATNFRADYNIDGFINSADATIVRARSGQFIP